MKINEIIKPSAKAIYESISQDTDHGFDKETCEQISESIANSKFEEMTVESFLKKLEQW